MASWISERFGRAVQACAQAVLGPQTTVHFDERAPASTAHTVAPPTVRALNPRYTFAQFVIGQNNRLAHAAALAVAEFPGQAYNPLFLHAPPGLGKTHLLHAIGNYTAQFGNGAKVLYVTAEDFTNHFLGALGSRSLSDFKRRYRDADLLLLDDVQFLAAKARTEEEFFHTFDALYETGRQLVVSCDRTPAQLLTVQERLRERFEAGLVADIHPPDFATRLTILRKRTELDQIPIADPAVLELIATHVTGNVRALEGALIRVVALHSLTGRRLDLRLAQEALAATHCQPRTSRPAVADIQRAVADHFGLSVQELVGSSRRGRVAWPRQLAIYLARELTDASLESVGKAFGGRGHTTVLYACKVVRTRLETDHAASAQLNELKLKLASLADDRRS